jgi:hypothetical protein
VPVVVRRGSWGRRARGGVPGRAAMLALGLLRRCGINEPKLDHQAVQDRSETCEHQTVTEPLQRVETFVQQPITARSRHRTTLGSTTFPLLPADLPGEVAETLSPQPDRAPRLLPRGSAGRFGRCEGHRGHYCVKSKATERVTCVSRRLVSRALLSSLRSRASPHTLPCRFHSRETEGRQVSRW